MKVTDDMIDAACIADRAFCDKQFLSGFTSMDAFEAWHRKRIGHAIEAALDMAPGNRIEIDFGNSTVDVGTLHAIAAVMAERVRQMATPLVDVMRDEACADGRIATLASVYALRGSRDCVIRAGALILAEIERLDRAACVDEALEA